MDTNIWLSEKERTRLQKKEAKIREMRHGSRLNKKVLRGDCDFFVLQKYSKSVIKVSFKLPPPPPVSKSFHAFQFTIDFAGRQVHEDTFVAADDDNDDDEVQDFSDCFTDNQLSENFPDLVNPSVDGKLPTFVPMKNPQLKIKNLWNNNSNRLQDKQLLEMSDPGMCLSMHQPWASLLVQGIKKDEGRSW